MKLNIFYLTFLIILFSQINIVFSQEYYADIIIDLSDDGITQITGISNHPDFQNKITHEFTYKNKEIWELNILTLETFSEYVYQLTFPENTEIIDFNFSGTYRVSTENNKIIINGTSKNGNLYLNAKYKINYVDNDFGYLFNIILLIIIITIIVFLNFEKLKAFLLKNKKNENINVNEDTLTDRQKEIYKFLKDNNGSATQKQIQDKTNLPKASLSRNIASLEKKGIIIKERKGMSMLITLKNNN